ncbi:MAG: outer membrane lipoprotein carrier protein LolA [Nitrospira sp. SB0677_bin_15]|nr:outer membrane lipoprotein carrier protein LolA [Nitrospira sp. SB0667_bin_9]MYD31003.1 outer membrane lipoprotein carrier protein LolA [Nitrospira sp. SB0661_bin_20]MYG39557.1 outer membrane lipoprotein carrier protein LolA [Nitrospira sp. SB0677_bin_15]MYH02826.1 outer membrane lipoprotein carrier protein LolA [Nitrospira sp. SB0675_bin_23]MYJ23816.1 outer membrane lipoprotein carrier protein LolA [Nitrospira sp. SB0673_bin_12]
MKQSIWILLWCVLVEVPALAQAKASDELGALVNRVDAQYAQIRDFQADFVQETRIQGFDTPVRSSGRVYLKKPGRLRWDYLDPSVEHIYVHEDQVAMYVPAHNQVLKGSLTMMVSTKAPLRLLQGIGKLAEHFTPQPTGDGEKGEGGLPLVTLIPKPVAGAPPSSLVKIVVEVQPRTYMIQVLALHENNGNVSIFQFSGFKVNKGLDDAVLILNPPEGVVIVEDFLPKS